MEKKFVSAALALVMALALFPSGVLADSTYNDALNTPGGEINFYSPEEDGNYPWVIVTDGERTYAKSDNWHVNDSMSAIEAEVHTDGNQIIRFDFIARGSGWDENAEEQGLDGCRFYVDGERVFYYGDHNSDWSEPYTCFYGYDEEVYDYVYIPLAEGDHILRWEYYKNDDGMDPYYSTGDFFAIDNVETVDLHTLSVNFVFPQGLVPSDGDMSENPLVRKYPEGEWYWVSIPQFYGYNAVVESDDIESDGYSIDGEMGGESISATVFYYENSYCEWQFDYEPDDWQFTDADGDGLTWFWNEGEERIDSQTNGSSSTENIASVSLNDPLPRNTARLEFTAKTSLEGGSDTVTVYCGEVGGSMTKVAGPILLGAEYCSYSVDLSEFAGTRVKVRFVHGTTAGEGFASTVSISRVAFFGSDIAYIGSVTDFAMPEDGGTLVGKSFEYSLSITPNSLLSTGYYYIEWDSRYLMCTGYEYSFAGSVESQEAARVRAEFSDYELNEPLEPVGFSEIAIFNNSGMLEFQLGLTPDFLYVGEEDCDVISGITAGGKLIKFTFRWKADPPESAGTRFPIRLMIRSDGWGIREGYIWGADFEHSKVYDGEVNLSTAVPDIMTEDPEIRERLDTDQKHDLRFLFRVPFNESYLMMNGQPYGDSGESSYRINGLGALIYVAELGEEQEGGDGEEGEEGEEDGVFRIDIDGVTYVPYLRIAVTVRNLWLVNQEGGWFEFTAVLTDIPLAKNEDFIIAYPGMIYTSSDGADMTVTGIPQVTTVDMMLNH